MLDLLDLELLQAVARCEEDAAAPLLPITGHRYGAQDRTGGEPAREAARRPRGERDGLLGIGVGHPVPGDGQENVVVAGGRVLGHGGRVRGEGEVDGGGGRALWTTAPAGRPVEGKGTDLGRNGRLWGT
ncbi:hypothetical protein G5V59_20795 [Nocardioides sp. W3-2-3]|uniref:hypothetical protein n=1 Tax=Nocardioides convexus TaxID=2712224 RepID=UPI002418A8E4|nr:hypothetical protein [Nocardioides convexus]NHA01440.1 hypothetical protein [Nocardioides convexus]